MEDIGAVLAEDHVMIGIAAERIIARIAAVIEQNDQITPDRHIYRVS